MPDRLRRLALHLVKALCLKARGNKDIFLLKKSAYSLYAMAPFLSQLGDYGTFERWHILSRWNPTQQLDLPGFYYSLLLPAESLHAKLRAQTWYLCWRRSSSLAPVLLVLAGHWSPLQQKVKHPLSSLYACARCEVMWSTGEGRLGDGHRHSPGCSHTGMLKRGALCLRDVSAG